MRISLRKQITAALVLFGLVPATIVAWFAYQTKTSSRRNKTSSYGRPLRG